MMEERRLAAEQQLEAIRINMERLTNAPTGKSESTQPIVINNIIPKASKKLGTIGTDELGNTTLSIDNVEE